MNFAKFDRTPFFKEHLWLLLLNPDKSFKSFSFCSLSSRSKLQKQSPKGVLQKYALKIFSKYTKIYLHRIFLIIKVQSDGLYIIKKRVSSICVISQINVFLERLRMAASKSRNPVGKTSLNQRMLYKKTVFERYFST